MKYFASILLLLGLFVGVLSGCGTNPASPESQESTNIVQNESQNPTEPARNNPTEPVETNSLDISGTTFEFTRTTFVNAVNDSFKNYPEAFLNVPNAFENEPNVTENLGCAVYTYEVDMCTKIRIYAHPETDNIVRLILESFSNEMTEENATAFGTYAAFITGVFAAEDEIDEMVEKLAIADTPYTQDTVNLFNGRNAKFSYTIVDGLLTVRISPAV